MKNILSFVIILFLLLIPVGFSQPEKLCFGAACYDKSYVPFKIEEGIIEAKLNRDGSVVYTQTIGGKYNLPQELDLDGLILPEFFLPKNSEVSPEISVTELLSNNKFEQRYEFEGYCDGTYIFDRSKNKITICLKVAKQTKIKISAIILPNLNRTEFKSCIDLSDTISNYLNIGFPATNYQYHITVETQGGEGVKMEEVGEDACQDVKGLNLKVSNMKSYPKTNGMLCQGTVLQLPSDKVFGIDLRLGGIDQIKIIEREQEELKNLQKQNINASIIASQATNIIKYTSIVNSVLTAILVLATIFYAYTTHATLEEDKKTKKKQSNDEVIESIYKPIYQETNSILHNLEEDLGLGSLSMQRWDYCKSNEIKNLVKVQPNLRREIEDFYKNIKEYNDSLNSIIEKVQDLVNNSLRANQQPTDIIYIKMRRGDNPVFSNFRTSIIKNKHPRDILKNYKGTKEGWATPNSEIFDDERNKKIDEIYKKILNLVSDDREATEFIQLRNKILDSAKQLKEKFESTIINLQSE